MKLHEFRIGDLRPGQGGQGGMVTDPPPPDNGMSLLDIPRDPGPGERGKEPRKLRLIDQWFDTSPKTAVRTVDLPLFDPPRLKLKARREGALLQVSLEGATVPVSTRWEAEGEITGSGLTVRWSPLGPKDRVRVAIRSRGGVAILSLQADAAEG